MRNDGVIRVFPRRTSYTPRDEWAFVGESPLFRPAREDVKAVHISVAFTWDLERGQSLAEAWRQVYGDKVLMGGPALTIADGFEPAMYVKEGVTFTTRGCPNRCPWCLVPDREGKLRELPIKEGWIVQDNNLLAAGNEHIAKVFAMLRAQKRAVDFAGGLESARISDEIADDLRSLSIREIFLAADTKVSLRALERAVKKLAGLNRRQLRCYVLCAFEDEMIDAAQERLQAVWDIGCLPFAQLYQPPDRYIHYSREWRELARTWSRPVAMFACHADVLLAVANEEGRE